MSCQFMVHVATFYCVFTNEYGICILLRVYIITFFKHYTYQKKYVYSYVFKSKLQWFIILIKLDYNIEYNIGLTVFKNNF